MKTIPEIISEDRALLLRAIDMFQGLVASALFREFPNADQLAILKFLDDTADYQA
jgi:hypothetical protein